jgi:fission process protein 1
MTSTVKEVRVSDGALEKKKEVDWFRDSPLRLTGYANEVGEAFRSQMHVRWVWASYGVASAYVLADTAHKASLAYRVSPDDDSERKILTKLV